ncbi:MULTISPECIES: MarR family winged helix-turn-helix transcriptional regulator [Brevibacillus]|jgi:DNA-binding MarR family transcriptional regulator|uniref:Transcriptional regulator n=1 Tax=Brevibacillus borstelensis AK1 TaxID=1300222 RepID=M8DHV6_9BACL|nr:MarR family transcriptional regulator [Brevibacillus borstelensis]EMT53103.1 transcriptional regulator [Brevibacillus borstelensis AK1]KKX55506.1 transcriptional regulator [Brevibacillus borstelensis cifa_chp40]MBE5397528.1 MarR family transcriptional regulator [Brevibacillus borstelensis]MCC0564938.1 MarR family transcriptional regulator [Brevibacillus borstelensis]MCM3469168.1 MarR family transcriptional regulator [Brevibacillus borstelensis]
MNKPVVIRDLLKRLNKTINMIAARELEKVGLTYPQLMVLRHLKDEMLTIGQISKAVDLSYSTVSGIIDRLEREQLVERLRDEKDRRVVWIRSTDKVREQFEKLPIFSEAYYSTLFSDFSDAELGQIVRALETLITKLEKES